MKIKYVIEHEVNFDLDTERQRIEKCFSDKSKVKKILNKMVDKFEKGHFYDVLELYEQLDFYDEEYECSSKEYVFPDIIDISSDIVLNKANVIEVDKSKTRLSKFQEGVNNY